MSRNLLYLMLSVCLLGGTLTETKAQTGCITLDQDYLNTHFADQNAPLILAENTHYCVSTDLNIGPRQIQAMPGSKLTIEENGVIGSTQGVKVGNPAGGGIFTLVVLGTVHFSSETITANGVDITIESTGKIYGGNPSGRNDVKFANASEDNQIIVKSGGELLVANLEFGNSDAVYKIENFGHINTNGNINMSQAEVDLRNSGTVEIGGQYNQNNKSVFVNCGSIITTNAYNLAGGKVYNTGFFKSNSGLIDVSGGEFYNYGTSQASGFNISSGEIYNQGLSILTGGSNALQGDGIINGPADAATGRGYFVFNDVQSNFNNKQLRGVLNFTIDGVATTDLQSVFGHVNNASTLIDNTVSFISPDGNGEYAFAESNKPVESYNVCPNSDGTFPVTLPITLSSFSAAKQGNTVVLNWSTASEQNNTGFYVERSNGGAWQALGFVNTKSENGASSTTLSYSYTDAAPAAGVNQYRLRQVDVDGKFTVSDVRQVSFDAVALSLYPNPVSSEITISGLSGTNKIVITNLSGQVVSSQTVSDVSVKTINVSKLAVGTYVVSITDNNGNKTNHKVVKQ